MFSCSWFTRKPPRDAVEVPIPPLKGDEFHCMTVLPYLVDHYFDDSSDDGNNVQFYTERELNGMILVSFYLFFSNF